MGQYRKIFLIVDPSGDESPAYTRAVVLAKRSGAALIMGLFSERATRDAGKALKSPPWLRDRVRQLVDQGIRAYDFLAAGQPLHRCIVDAVIESQADLVVKDYRNLPSAWRIFGTLLDYELVRICPAPLLLVRPDGAALPQRVLAAIDAVSGDDRRPVNDRILKEAIGLSLQCDAQVAMAYAFETLPITPVPDALSVHGSVLPKVLDELREQRRQELFAFAEAHSIPEDRRYFLDGTPESAVARLAADIRADVVVMGTNYRTGLERLAFGSTAERLLNRLKCDVLVVKPESFAADLDAFLHLEAGAPRRASA